VKKAGKGGFGYAICLLANMPKCHKMPKNDQMPAASKGYPSKTSEPAFTMQGG